ncbi:hypothetical protein SAMN02910276_02853 [Butyrivibrio sp. Su6]|uniref:hypothetical protein n=1 Tax=Butyrivibrio sp. Su6 TaxID=1520810 RepID=UPI00089EB955|nr:hypothetical protein [Butyrivibrio sp. Su6]SEG40997.1 hypothetical protein SAMN02910276_02853 [Butyrivibrio sp. Su6]
MKRIVNLLLMGCILLSLVGCTASESNAEGVKISNETEAGQAAADNTVQSEQVTIEENVGVGNVDNENQLYDVQKLTTLDGGLLKIDPDCDYHFKWDTSTIEENEDGSFTGTFDFAYVRIPVVITKEVFSSIEVGCELPKIDHLAYEWGDFKCVQIQDGKKFFVDSCYDSVDEAKSNDSLTICFDESCKDSKGNIFACVEDEEEPGEYTQDYDYHEFNEQVKVKIAANAKIEYIKSVKDNDLTYDTVDFKTFLSEDIKSDYGNFAEREWGMSTDSWHGTGELRVTGNEAGEIVFIEEFWPAG